VTRYAHETPGSGTIVADGVSLRRAAVAVVIALAIAGVALRTLCLWPVAVAALATLVWTAVCRRRFGGITGDTLGANVEICETLGLAVLTAFR
jgi:adenosylcobinamide-GDP ribazoletransferase